MNDALRRWAGDGLLAGVALFFGLGGTRPAGEVQHSPVTAITYVLVVTVALSLVVRRRWPFVTLAVAAAGTSVYMVLEYPYGPILLSLMVAVYTVARHRPLKPAAVAAGATLVVLLVHTVVHPDLSGVVPGAAWVVVPFAVGFTVRVGREAAMRARDDLARQYADEERLRVAQEVHDVVGHGLAAIKMQADIALHLLARKPEQAEIALTAISRTSEAALDELRATLTVVRSTDRSPAPGLHNLAELQDRMSKAGMRVQVDVRGEARHLPAAVDLAGYRIVQESLTNVLKHSEVKQATVHLGYEDDGVVIAIWNPASAPVASGGGFGIPGMRERVTSLGGSFSAGPTGDGRFEVRASIPVVAS